MTTFESHVKELNNSPIDANAEQKNKLIWDLPLRVGHWALVACFLGAWFTSDSEYFARLHLLFGYSVLALLVFRFFWGFIGSRYARWKSFMFSRREILSYLSSISSSSAKKYLGHNPLGSLGIFLMLSLLIVLVATGLGLDLISSYHWLSEVHEAVAELMLIVIFVHVAGVLISGWLHHESLISSMIHGKKNLVPTGAQIPHAYWGGLGLLVLLLCFSTYYVLMR